MRKDKERVKRNNNFMRKDNSSNLCRLVSKVKNWIDILIFVLIMCRCPYYYHMKFAFLVWLQLPSADVRAIFFFSLNCFYLYLLKKNDNVTLSWFLNVYLLSPLACVQFGYIIITNPPYFQSCLLSCVYI